MAGDEIALESFLDEVRLKARDHARSPVQVSVSPITTIRIYH
jgi:hypothetical protein